MQPLAPRTPSRRASTRHPVSLPALLDDHACELLDLSRGGALIACARVLVVGSTVTVAFTLPISAHEVEPIAIDATVRWTDHRGYGVSFGSLRAREMWALGLYLAQCAGI